jgi:hypothetical protein
MIKNFIVFFIFSISFYTSGQIATIKELRIPVALNSEGSIDSVIFPMVKTAIKTVDEKINKIIRDTLLFPQAFKNGNLLPLRKLIDSNIASGLYYLDYEINFNKNGLLSIQFYTEMWKAYLTYQDLYLNFNLENGDLIPMNELIKPGLQDTFWQLVHAKKNEEIENKIAELSESHESNYTIAAQLMKDCGETIEQDAFYLSSVELVIIEKCAFPHYLRNLEPELEILISISEMSYYLKPEIFKKLTE